MKKLILSFLAITLISVLLINYVSANKMSNIYVSSTTLTGVLEFNNNHTPAPDSILEVCPPPPYANLVPANANVIGTDMIEACMYDTLDYNLDTGYSYLWSDNSTDRTYRFYTTGIGYDVQTHYVIATHLESGCADTAWITVHFKAERCALGVSEIINEAFGKIYPNPGNGLYNLPVKEIEGDAKVEVLDVNGQLKYYENITNVSKGSIHSIDLKGLSNGLFFVRIITQDHIHVEKIVKQ